MCDNNAGKNSGNKNYIENQTQRYNKEEHRLRSTIRNIIKSQLARSRSRNLHCERKPREELSNEVKRETVMQDKHCVVSKYRL